jgi:hypothetical protein
VGAVLFFYSGHGIQLDNNNYLIPTDSALKADDLVALDDLLQKLGKAPAKAVKLVFLDACRDNNRLPEGAPRGMANPSSPPPPNILEAFSASPNQLAESGFPEEKSVYTNALLSYLPVPGLELKGVFAKVHTDVFRFSDTGQETFQAGTLHQDFFFRDPVFIKARTFGWPDSPLVVLHEGKVVLRANEAGEHSLQMNAGENHLTVLVSTGKTYHNGQVWGATEGWSYRLELEHPGGENGDPVVVPFQDREEVPFKEGPHHGQSFVVAEVTVVVDPMTAKVTITHLDAQAASKGLPFWADHQEILFQAKLVDLNISPDDVLGGLVNFTLAPLFKPILADFLKTGKILGNLVVDPDKTFVSVRGNKMLRSVAEHCMTEGLPDRLRDLRASFAAFFNDRNPRPFDVFAQGLDACIRANALGLGITLKPEDLRVWTSIDDPTDEVPQVETPAGESLAAAEAPSPTVLSDESLMAMAQDALLLPRADEFLLPTRSVEQTVQGVPIKAEVYTFLSVGVVDDKIKLHARAIADLSDFQNKIGALVDTIPLPTDNCSHFGLDNIVARIWGKQITVSGNVATLKLNGDVEIWTCVKNPIPCIRTVFDEVNTPLGTIRIPRPEPFDCNPPIKNRNLSQPFEATLPFSVAVVDSDTFAIKLGDPDVDLGGALGGVTEGILKIAGVDVNAKVKEALDQAVNPELLKQNLPEFLLKYNPTLTRAELLSNSGALALTLEADAILDAKALGELIQEFSNSQ